MDNIKPISGLKQISNVSGKQNTGEDIGFADKLRSAIAQTNQSQVEADRSIEEVVYGTMGIHEGMLKIQEADISLRLLLQVRNKVMDAYKEIIHMAF